MTPTARSLKHLRSEGWDADVVEKRCAEPSCVKRLHVANACGRCKEHRNRAPSVKARGSAYYAEHRVRLLARAHERRGFATRYALTGRCSADGCDAQIRNVNKTGLCKKHIKLAWARRNYCPERESSRRLRLQYGLSLEAKRDLLTRQGGCAICAAPATGDMRLWHTDHCHATGKVRGVLCRRCNLALGFLDDSVESMRRAIAYLERA